MRTFLTILFQILLCGFHANAAVTLTASEGTDPKLSAEVQRTIDSFNAIVQEELGVTLNKSVSIRLCPTEACYINLLRTEANYSEDKAQLVGKVSGGLAVSGKRLILLKLQNATNLQRARAVTAHELTHMLQAELTDELNGSSRANRWIKEGLADWMGALISNRLGSESLEKWKLDRINTLRRASQTLKTSEMDAVSFDQWTRWMEEKRMPYETADLMTMALAERPNMKLLPSIAGYSKCLNSYSFESTCFQENFGISQRDFYTELEGWFQRAMTSGKTLEIIADGIAPESVKPVENAFNQAQMLLRERLGSELPITLRIFLLPDSAAMSAAIARELGRSQEEADKLAKGSASLWQDSTVFFDLGRIDTPERLAATTASTVTGRYLQVVGSNKGQLPWLGNGLRDYFATATLDALGLRTIEQSAQQGKEALRKATKGLPALAELQTADSYRKAQGKYGSTIVSQYAAIAVRQFVANKGTNTLGNWVRRSKTEADPQAAFAASLGEAAEPVIEALDARVKKDITEG